MKQILLLLVAGFIIFFIIFIGFGPTAEVVTPEVQKTGRYERPVKDGNCYLQKDSTGNDIRVCG